VSDAEPDTAYWRRNRRLVAGLLAVWFAVGFGVAWFARDLGFGFFGWPFSFWVGAQGALLVFLAIIGVYAWVMNRMDAAQPGADHPGHE
jgi:putative solute:sodium symporter small subunit